MRIMLRLLIIIFGEPLGKGEIDEVDLVVRFYQDKTEAESWNPNTRTLEIEIENVGDFSSGGPA